MSDVTSTSNLEHGDPERVVRLRDYVDPNYTIFLSHPELDLRGSEPAGVSELDDKAYKALSELVEIWTQPLRSPEHVRNAKFRLEREWTEFFNAINTIVEAAIESDPDYKAWLKEHKMSERKS